MQDSNEKMKIQNTNLFHRRQISFCFLNKLSSSVLPPVHSEVLLPKRPVSTFSLFKTDFRYVTQKAKCQQILFQGTEIFTGVFNISFIGEILTIP